MWLRCPNMLNWWRIVFVIYFQRHCNKYSQEYMPWLRCKSLCDVGFLSNIHSIIPIVLLIYLMVIIIHDWLCEWHNLTLFLVFYIDWWDAYYNDTILSSQNFFPLIYLGHHLSIIWLVDFIKIVMHLKITFVLDLWKNATAKQHRHNNDIRKTLHFLTNRYPIF